MIASKREGLNRVKCPTFPTRIKKIPVTLQQWGDWNLVGKVRAFHPFLILPF